MQIESNIVLKMCSIKLHSYVSVLPGIDYHRKLYLFKYKGCLMTHPTQTHPIFPTWRDGWTHFESPAKTISYRLNNYSNCHHFRALTKKNNQQNDDGNEEWLRTLAHVEWNEVIWSHFLWIGDFRTPAKQKWCSPWREQVQILFRATQSRLFLFLTFLIFGKLPNGTNCSTGEKIRMQYFSDRVIIIQARGIIFLVKSRIFNAYEEGREKLLKCVWCVGIMKLTMTNFSHLRYSLQISILFLIRICQRKDNLMEVKMANFKQMIYLFLIFDISQVKEVIYQVVCKINFEEIWNIPYKKRDAGREI